MKLFRFLSAARRPRTDWQPSRRMFLEALEERLTPSLLIPVPNRRDHVYDATRQILYIGTGAGTLQRYDVAGQQLLTPFTVGGPLNGLDLTQDARFAYVADTQCVGNECFIRKVNLDTGAVTSLAYTRDLYEGGPWDLAIANNGKALFDGTYEGSGWVPLRQIDLNTDTLSIRQDRPLVRQNTHITRGADRSLFFLTESNVSNGPVFTYDAGTNSFPRSASLGGFHGLTMSAVSRDGQLIAMKRGTTVTIMDRDLNTIRTLAGFGGGVAFHPTRNLLLAVDAAANQVVGINAVTWTAGFRVDIGEDVPDGTPMDNGVISVSPDGSLLFLSTPSGVRVVDLPNNPGVVTFLALTDFPRFIGRAVPGTFTVTARDAFGDVVPTYTGTVTFTSTDPSAVLPANYTFTPANQGRRTFTATLNGIGTFSLTVRDVAVPALMGTQTGIVVHSGVNTTIPVANRRDHVWDAKRGMLYIGTEVGIIERYDAATGTLLAPYRVGTSLNGLDITPDARFLYALEATTGGGTQGFIYKIDLITGTVTNIRYAADGEGGWDIAIANNGRALFDTQFPGSGFVQLRELNLATGAIINRRAVMQDTPIFRGADRSLLFLTMGRLSSGPILTYAAATNSFPREANTFALSNDVVAAVSRDGSLIAVELGNFPGRNFGTTVMDRDFQAVHSLGTRYRGGLAFDPLRDILYAVDSTAGVVVAFDTNTWAERFRLNVGETYPDSRPFDNGILTVSADGKWLFVSTPSGVRVVALPGNPGVVSRFVFHYPRFTGPGVANTFAVTAVDALGSTVTNYTGTVQFTSTDPAAQLPAPYTFQPGDRGRHTFTAAFNTVGTFSLTARDVDSPAVTTTQTGIVIHDGTAALIPVPDRRDHVWDHARNRLYLSTAGGLIERYDLATQTLLEPWRVGGEVNGLDITPDGAFLYVNEGGRSAVQGLLYKIHLHEGLKKTLTFNPNGAGGWGLAIANNGKALFDAHSEDSTFVELRDLTLATGAITDRRSVSRNAHVTRGAGRGLLFFAESYISNGPIFTYDAATNTFPRSLELFVDHQANLSAVNRDDTLIALELDSTVQIFDRNLVAIRVLGNLNGGLAFDPLRNVLYAARAATGRLVAYNTQTWGELFDIPVGESFVASQPFNNGEMTVSADGRFVFLSTPSGVRLIELGRGGAPGLPARGGAAADGIPVRRLDALALVGPALEERPRGAGAVAALPSSVSLAVLTASDPMKAADPFVRESAAARTEARPLEPGDWSENWLSDRAWEAGSRLGSVSLSVGRVF